MTARTVLPEGCRAFRSLDDLFIPVDMIADPDYPHYTDENGWIHFHLLQTENSEAAVCPHCGSTDCCDHGYSMRKCQILPIAGQTAFVHIRQKRRICRNSDCQATSFVMPSNGFKMFQQRSDQLNLAIFAISVFCSDKAAEIICRTLGIQVSHDSIRRLLSNIRIEDNPDVEVIGVDDVCLRKGQTYYTVVYDGEDHHLLALLQGRDGEELKKWLRNHRKVKMIARDRAGAYAKAIQEVLPDCIQVADRFHLFQNLMDRLKTVFKAELPSTIYIQDERILDGKPELTFAPMDVTQTEEFKALDYDNTPPIDENGEPVAFIDKCGYRTNAQYARQEQGRKEKYTTACRLRSEWNQRKGENKRQNKDLRLELGKKYGLCDVTIRKYLRMTEDEVESLLEIRSYKKRETQVNDYLNMIYKMLRDRISPSVIFQYVRSKGCSSTDHSLECHIKAISLNNGFGKHRKSAAFKPQMPKGIIEIKRTDILKYMTIKDKSRMEDTDTARWFDQIVQKYPIISELKKVWDDFYCALMGDEVSEMDEFLKKYGVYEEEDSPKREWKDYTDIEKFAEGLKKDIAPVKNAISFSLSSGFVEGGNCRYKSTKRLMFGRAKQDHLFRKTYAISIIMRQSINSKVLLMDWLKNTSRRIWPKRKKRDVTQDIS
ncbi:ISL3 family transposase [Erysipelotrichaceae bacterium 51-3]